jgi:ubiquinone biosynthesis protein Coq4
VTVQRYSKIYLPITVLSAYTRGDFIMPFWLKIVLKIAQIINPQINLAQEFTITVEELEELRQLPNDTLGREVAQFLDNNGFDPLNSGDWIQRTHDVWHVLTGFGCSPHDELLLQIFTRAQVFRPTSAIVVTLGLLTGMCNFREVRQVLKMGKQAKPIMGWDIKTDWKTPLVEVRKKFNIIPLNSMQQGFANSNENLIVQRPVQ